jgi:hypothetical protein
VHVIEGADGQLAGRAAKASSMVAATFLATPNSLTMREMTRPLPWTWKVVALPSCSR